MQGCCVSSKCMLVHVVRKDGTKALKDHKMVLCRTFAQLVLHQLLEDFPEAMPETSNQTSPWQACLQFFRTNPDMQRVKKSTSPGLCSYDPQRAITPQAVLCTVGHLPLHFLYLDASCLDYSNLKQSTACDCTALKGVGGLLLSSKQP